MTADDKESILDRVLETQIEASKAQFNPPDIVNSLLNNLSERDKQIVIKRHGWGSDTSKKTLEEIGREYHITRERVRQIEVASVKQISQQIKEKEDYNSAIDVIEQILKEQGGIIEESSLINKIRELVPQRLHKNTVVFFLNLVKDKFIIVKESKDVYSGWQLPDFNEELLVEVLKTSQETMEAIGEIISDKDFWEKFKQTEVFKTHQSELTYDTFLSFIKISKRLRANPFGDWGLSKWNLITPKRMNDKIYLVLKDHGRPLHFRKIAEKINEVKFDGKQAHPATVHNELILDHGRYVLVGRGIYALKEWGYKPGIVADVIKEVLQTAPQALTRQQIIDEVLKKRMVKETTITLALTNKKDFKKLSDGTYQLVANQ